jgi:methylated-DNA-protein-cysteine methyltransferase related protein
MTSPDDPSFSLRVYRMVQRIPPGRVIAYGGVAALLGTPRAARGVGHALASLPEGAQVPWWRVVNSKGEISLTHHRGMLQRTLLQAEGVRFERGGRIDLSRYGWKT